VIAALKIIEDNMVLLSDTLTRKYLVHSGVPRQFSENGGAAP